MSTLTVSLTARRADVRFVALVAGLPALLGVAQLVPHTGAGAAFRLAAAAACVLLVPGALIMRLTGWPRELGVALAGALVWSLAAIFVCLLLTFAFAASLALTLGLLAALAFATAIPVALRRAPDLDRADLVVTTAVAAGGVVLAVVVWLVSEPFTGDGLFHLARVRKLVEFGSLDALTVVDEFKDGGLHPGYAFPLWHGAVALVAKLSGLDPGFVVRYLSAILVPLAVVVAYGAGRVLFRSPWGGAAAVLPLIVLYGFPAGRTGAFRALALPATASRQLLVTALLALGFAYIRTRSGALLAAFAAGGLALALVHPTYAVFLGIALAGFLVARAVLAHTDVARIGAVLLALIVPTACVAFWLLPILKKTTSYTASQGELHRALSKYADQLAVTSDHSFTLSPRLFTGGGALAIAALAVIPLAALAARRTWAAYVLGSSLAVFLLTLVPFIFPRFADVVSISQTRRMGLFVPFAFALAGAAAVLARLLRWAVLPVAAAAGIALQLEYPAGFSYDLAHAGPAIATWIAAIGGAIALAGAAVFARKYALDRQGALAFAAVALLVTPAAVHAFSELDTAKQKPGLTPGLVDALRQRVPPKAVVFSDDVTGYLISAAAPVYVNSAQPAHVADTTDNRPFKRRDDALRFMRTGDLAVLKRYHAQWLVVNRARFHLRLKLRPVYRDRRYVLYRV